MRLACRLAATSLVLGLCLSTATSWAVGTPSGTSVDNVATLQYTLSGAPRQVVSNTASFRVDEVVDVVVQKSDANSVVVASPDSRRVLVFRITNTGNGTQRFTLTTTPAPSNGQFAPTVLALALDTNGNGVYDPGIDVDYVAGQNDPTIEADRSATVFVLADIPSSRANGDLGALTVTAKATIGSGAPGTVFAGKGARGSDAVVGASGGLAAVQSAYLVSQLQPVLSKTLSIANASGSTEPMPGTLVTYALRLELRGSGTAINGVIADTIPANTTYVPGSLRLDGLALTDVGDGDAGRWNGSAVEVSLGAVVAPATHVVTFQVRLN